LFDQWAKAPLANQATQAID